MKQVSFVLPLQSNNNNNNNRSVVVFLPSSRVELVSTMPGIGSRELR